MSRPERDELPAWRRWCHDQGVHPVAVLLEIQKHYRVEVPSSPGPMPLRQRDVDERVAELRPYIVDAVDRLRGRRKGAA